MRPWSAGAKLAYIAVAVPAALTAMIGFWEWQAFPQKVLVPGQPQAIDHTVGAILRNRAKSSRYLIFSAALADSALEGAKLHFKGPVVVDNVQISAAPGRVTWRNGRYDRHDVPGLRIRVQASIRLPDGAPPSVDTLMLNVPMLSALGDRNGEDVLISFNGNSPRRGDSVIMQRYQFYPSPEAVEHARRKYLVLSVVAATAFVGIVARAIWRTMH